MNAELAVLPIVEGHGDERAVRILLDRTWRELLGGTFIHVLRPIRLPRTKLVADRDELRRAVDLAALKLKADPASRERRQLVLILADADEDPACELAPKLLSSLGEQRSDVATSVVLAVQEYETWFVGAAESLSDLLDLDVAGPPPSEPESAGARKGWIERCIAGRYSETLDQPRLTARMDLALCRQRCPSFDKLCRELERQLPG